MEKLAERTTWKDLSLAEIERNLAIAEKNLSSVSKTADTKEETKRQAEHAELWLRREIAKGKETVAESKQETTTKTTEPVKGPNNEIEKQRNEEIANILSNKKNTDDKYGFVGLNEGGGIAMALYKQIFEAMQQGKDTVGGIKERLIPELLPLFNEGKLKSGEDIYRYMAEKRIHKKYDALLANQEQKTSTATTKWPPDEIFATPIVDELAEIQETAGLEEYLASAIQSAFAGAEVGADQIKVGKLTRLGEYPFSFTQTAEGAGTTKYEGVILPPSVPGGNYRVRLLPENITDVSSGGTGFLKKTVQFFRDTREENANAVSRILAGTLNQKQ